MLITAYCARKARQGWNINLGKHGNQVVFTSPDDRLYSTASFDESGNILAIGKRTLMSETVMGIVQRMRNGEDVNTYEPSRYGSAVGQNVNEFNFGLFAPDYEAAILERQERLE